MALRRSWQGEREIFTEIVAGFADGVSSAGAASGAPTGDGFGEDGASNWGFSSGDDWRFDLEARSSEAGGDASGTSEGFRDGA